MTACPAAGQDTRSSSMLPHQKGIQRVALSGPHVLASNWHGCCLCSHQGQTALRQQCRGVPVTSASGGDMAMDSRTLETYRQRLLALQQHLMQRIFGTEESMLAMDA